MRVLFVGAGAIGGYFGGRMLQAGRDVTFLVRPRRASELAAAGLVIKSPNGDVTLKNPPVVQADTIKDKFDVVLLSCKAYDLDDAVKSFAPAVGERTAIIPLLNGMRHMDVLTARFGAKSVVGGVVKCATTLDKDGRILQLAGFQDLAYGERDGKPSPRMTALDAFMQGAGFDARLTPHIAREMWEKWLMLASIGAICCTMRGTVGDVVAAPGGLDFIQGVIGEVVAIINAVGVAPSAEAVARITANLTQAGSKQSPSMYRDLVQGLPVEGDAIVGDMVLRGQKAGIAAPLLAAAATHLAVYSQRQVG